MGPALPETLRLALSGGTITDQESVPQVEGSCWEI
jgi:hypothetical protein